MTASRLTRSSIASPKFSPDFSSFFFPFFLPFFPSFWLNRFSPVRTGSARRFTPVQPVHRRFAALPVGSLPASTTNGSVRSSASQIWARLRPRPPESRRSGLFSSGRRTHFLLSPFPTFFGSFAGRGRCQSTHRCLGKLRLGSIRPESSPAVGIGFSPLGFGFLSIHRLSPSFGSPRGR